MKRLQTLVALILILWVAVPSFAGEPTEQIKETTNNILAIVSDPALAVPEREEERKIRIREAVKGRFYWEEMSRRALARHWAKRTEAEKEEFIDLFGKLLERTYLEKVEGYSGEKVMYTGEVTDERYPDRAIVKVNIVTHTDTEIAVAYKVRKVGDQWLVYDIAIEGVSMVNNYRKQFRGMKYPEIVKRLKRKVGEK
ncbi:MAG: ABC transporter substrate-binding protein [Deltaproteobacteria bacterium]|nr:ABC transporter substrate-binding protein [Deltaproteobacteria bacterium]